MNSGLIDISRLENALVAIHDTIVGGVTFPIGIEDGGTGVTTEEDLRKLVIGFPDPIVYGRYEDIIIRGNSPSAVVAIGYDAMLKYNPETRPTGSTAIGTYAMGQGSTSTTIENTIAIGYNAFGSCGVGNERGCRDSVAVGTAAGSISSGIQNIFIGSHCGSSGVHGSDNVYIGYNIGTEMHIGTNENRDSILIGSKIGTVGQGGILFSRSIVIGSKSGVGSLSKQKTFRNNVVIGYQADVTGENQFQLGNSNNTVYAYGSVQDRSDERDKANIRDIEYPYKEFILGLRPVTFQWDYREDYMRDKDGTSEPVVAHINDIVRDGSHIRSRRHNGFIAQEVKELMDSLGFDFAGYQDHSVNGGDDVLSLGYSEFIAPMVKMIQEQQKTISTLEEKVDQLTMIIKQIQEK